MDEYEIKPENIYNMDEKGFLIGVLPKSKRVFSRRAYECEGIKQRMQGSTREWIITNACICADNTSLSPALIYQAASGNLQDTWLQDLDAGSHRCFVTSPSGWTNNGLGLAWLRDIFDRETKGKARRDRRLLFLDGHGSHVTMEFLNYCEQSKILAMTYPPHSTHTLQPLDVGIFSPLSRAYGDELEAFLHTSLGLSAVTKKEIFRFFWPSWEKASSPKKIESSWRSVGLWPLDPEVVLAKFNRRSDESPSPSEPSQSPLEADDWRNIVRLVEEVSSDVNGENTKN